MGGVMSELRMALLLISAVVLGALSWWEWRRPRQASSGTAELRSTRDSELTAPAPRRLPESTLTLPEIRAHEPFSRPELPVMELRPAAAPVPEPPPPAVDLPGPDLEATQPEPPSAEPAIALAEVEAQEPEPRAPPPAAPLIEPATAAALAAALAEELPRLPAAPSPRVEWPPDTERRIVSLRLVATGPERFIGRSLRQALAAEGFVLGRFAIFHKPDEEQRAILSAANLTRPGTFDAETMDSQHFGGLSLFAVLPGPRPASQAFEDLVSTARNLNDRLQGALQDERGSPLTTARIALLRERVNSGALS
jgi:cell division protein ZipA